MTATQVVTPAVFTTEQEVRDFFAPLGVREVRRLRGYDPSAPGDHYVDTNTWEVKTTSNHRTVGKFLYEHDLLERCGGSGTGSETSFYLDHPPWKDNLPRSWLPSKAVKKDDYHPEVVACKKALVDAGFKASYLRSGSEEGVKVTDDAVPFNLAFVVDGFHKTLHAKVLTSGQTFRNQHRYEPVTVEQAVTLTKRAAALLVNL